MYRMYRWARDTQIFGDANMVASPVSDEMSTGKDRCIDVIECWFF